AGERHHLDFDPGFEFRQRTRRRDQMTDLQRLILSRRSFTAGAFALAASPLLAKFASAQTPVAFEEGAEGELEIFSWWTTGGEAAGLDQLFAAFSAGSP